MYFCVLFSRFTDSRVCPPRSPTSLLAFKVRVNLACCVFLEGSRCALRFLRILGRGTSTGLVVRGNHPGVEFSSVVRVVLRHASACTLVDARFRAGHKCKARLVFIFIPERSLHFRP